MSQDITGTETPSIESVRRRFEDWREIRKLHEPIPPELWKAAASLCTVHRAYIIARKLRLNYTKLKEHLDAAPADLPSKKTPTEADFVDLGFASPPCACEYVIEMQDPAGGKMRFQFKGHQSPDPMKICKAFWSKGS
jgi:hypothetical protein